ncbi:hypothetical protein [Dactylosporangium sucinum]|uniref:hypothetical protein n=1 Tax=Dactylosporangium sucinum TaxID=1424081 RepID=UPI00167C9AED|nr:hypothetical protein [Dactylosporangium sucinum]
MWVLIPSSNLCPTGEQSPAEWATDWIQQCNSADYPAQQLRGYLLPITLLVAVGAVLWQAINATISRKGEPLLQVARGLWNTALWTAIGIAGTHALLKAGDAYSWWILDKAIFSDSAKPPNETMSAALVALLVPASAATGGMIAPFVIIIIGTLTMVVALLQVCLMVFREGSVVILAGLTQLAAAGTISRGTTSQWLQKVLSWSLALALYKPAACTAYAAAFAMMAGTPRDFVMGLAMLGMSIIALPVLLKFFTIFTGSVGGGNSSIGMFGAGAAAGMHAASSLRGAVGGNNANDHARYLETTGPGSGGHGGTGPTGAVPTPPSPGSGPSGGNGPAKPKVIDGELAETVSTTAKATVQTNVAGGTGATAPTAGAMSGMAGGAGATGAASGAAGGAAGGAAAGGTAAAGAAGGPIGIAVAGAAMVGKGAVDGARRSAAAAGSTMHGEDAR